MAYSNKILKQANTILAEKRDKNKYISEQRKNEIYTKFPEYAGLKKEMVALLGEYVKSVGNGTEVDVKQLKEKIYLNEQSRKAILENNGYCTNYLDEIYDCKECKDTGYIVNKKCSCLEQLLRQIAAQQSNLNYILGDQNFDNFDLNIFSDNKIDGVSPRDNMKTILSHTKSFIDSFDSKDTKSLLFTGSTGVGKTFLSSCIADLLIKKGVNVLYQSSAKVTEMLEEFKFNRENSEYDSETIKELYNTDLLIIDDFGTEFKTSYTLTALYELINSRLINNKKLIITTNLTVKELKDIYSERLFSRFIGEFLILEFMGNDIRTKKIFENK